LTVALESGPGATVTAGGFTGTLRDDAAHVALALRATISTMTALEASLGAGLHLIELNGVVTSDSSPASATRLDAAVEPRLALCFRTLGGKLELVPWAGVSVLTHWQRFLVHGTRAVEVGALGMEGALSAALAFP
jgi:hypothetical protein